MLVLQIMTKNMLISSVYQWALSIGIVLTVHTICQEMTFPDKVCIQICRGIGNCHVPKSLKLFEDSCFCQVNETRMDKTEMSILQEQPSLKEGLSTRKESRKSGNMTDHDKLRSAHKERKSHACPPEYHKSTQPPVCYELHLEKILWKDARDACSAKGERLVFVDTEEKLTTVRSVIRNNATTRRMTFSVGAEDLDRDGVWYWLNGTKVTYTACRPRHPGEGSGCLNLNRGGHHLWNDADCSRSFSYICERTLP